MRVSKTKTGDRGRGRQTVAPTAKRPPERTPALSLTHEARDKFPMPIHSGLVLGGNRLVGRRNAHERPE
jgi:hypothetical protein